MKKLLFAFIFISAVNFAVFAQENVQTASSTKTANAALPEREKFDPKRIAADDLKAALAQAEKENKRIILDIGGEWCVWCIKMDNFIAANKDLKTLRDKNFVWLKINMSEENENKEFLSAYPAATGYPHLYVLEKDGTLLKSKDTVELEEGKTYNLLKFTEFLTEYAPAKKAAK